MASFQRNTRRSHVRIRCRDITEDYEVDSHNILGTGISASVVLCTSKATNRKLALKTLADGFSVRGEMMMHWKACTNDSIVSLIEAYQSEIDGALCAHLIMELMEGRDLFNQIKKIPSFPEQRAATLAYIGCTHTGKCYVCYIGCTHTGQCCLFFLAVTYCYLLFFF